MMLLKSWIFGAILGLAIATQALATEERTSSHAADEARTSQLHNEFDAESFRGLEKAGEPIEFESIDYPLLSAAVFHETNRRRAQHDLHLLSSRKELREAARIQAQGMKRSGTVGHQHPEAELRSLTDRVEHVGLRLAYAAENVAMTFGIQYEEGTPVVPQEQNGRTLFQEPGGETIPPHTYISFAQALLDQWMDSPGHRDNILSQEPQQLGVGHVHSQNDAGMDIFYSVQVFFTEQSTPSE